jgi:probable rRNA maturation factor
MNKLQLDIVGELPEQLSIKPLQDTFEVLLENLTDLPQGTINLTFVDDSSIQKLNKTYSGNDYPTDVLSFDYREDGGPIGDVIGEIAISEETATRQASEAHTSLDEEVALLGLHGVLHILGYDHAEAGEQASLQILQRDLLTAAGVTFREFKWES